MRLKRDNDQWGLRLASCLRIYSRFHLGGGIKITPRLAFKRAACVAKKRRKFVRTFCSLLRFTLESVADE